MLRDYFAAHAPPMTEQWWKDSRWDNDHILDAEAAWCFAHADAMIRRRSIPSEKNTSALLMAAQKAQCPCSIPERDSGHLSDCWMPGLLEAIDNTKGDI